MCKTQSCIYSAVHVSGEMPDLGFSQLFMNAGEMRDLGFSQPFMIAGEMPDLGFSQLFMVAGEMPDFSIPDAEQEFIGDPDDKKDQANHRKRLAQLEVQQQDKKVPALHCMCCPACMHVLQARPACMHAPYFCLESGSA